MQISLIGAGNMGLCVAGALSSKHKVVVYDTDPSKAAMMRTNFAELRWEQVRDDIEFTTTYPTSEVYLICVQTPAPKGVVDYTALKAALSDCAQHAPKDATIAVLSTVFPGGMMECIEPLERLGRLDLIGKLLYHPVFLRAGFGIDDYRNPGKIIIGHNGTPTGEKAADEFSGILGRIGTLVTWHVAEWVKMTHNSFMCVKITFANEMGDLIGPAAEQVMEAVFNENHYGRLLTKSHLMPGAPYSGQCLPKDAKVLQTYATRPGVLTACYASNEQHKQRIAEWLQEGKRPGIVGVAFRPGHDDCRGSLALDLMTPDTMVYDPAYCGKSEDEAKLLARGDARVPYNKLRSTTLSDVFRMCDRIILNRPLNDAERVVMRDYERSVLDVTRASCAGTGAR